MTRHLLVLAALAVLTTACESDPTGPQCTSVSLTTTATLGDTVVLNTGLRYVEGTAGTGSVVEYCDQVLVEYTGSFPDGRIFDEGLQPIDPYLGYGQLIEGFEQGLVGMRVGGTRRLIVPPALGYGSADVINPNTDEVSIPANSTLIFDVEMLARRPL